MERLRPVTHLSHTCTEHGNFGMEHPEQHELAMSTPQNHCPLSPLFDFHILPKTLMPLWSVSTKLLAARSSTCPTWKHGPWIRNTNHTNQLQSTDSALLTPSPPMAEQQRQLPG